MKVALVHYWLVTMRGGEKVLESLCKTYATDLLISENAAEKLSKGNELKFVADAQIRGKTESMKVYTS